MSHSSVLLTELRTMSLSLWCLQQWAVNTWSFVITLKNLLIKFTRLCPLERPWNRDNVPFWLCSSQSLPGKWPLEWKKFLLLSDLDPQSHHLLPENFLLQLCTPEWRKCYKGSLREDCDFTLDQSSRREKYSIAEEFPKNTSQTRHMKK